ncbi:MAG: hypothetical protein EA362_07500 [Saprospirales bacterium]|nr:MAG: hypothetical protein EA362_07500 [Saprospirales bacterium]
MEKQMENYVKFVITTYTFWKKSDPIGLNPEKDIAPSHNGINYQTNEYEQYGHLEVAAVSLVAFPSAQPSMFR